MSLCSSRKNLMCRILPWTWKVNCIISYKRLEALTKLATTYELFDHKGKDWRAAAQEIFSRSRDTRRETIMTMTIPLPTYLTMADSVRNIFKKWWNNVVRRVIVGPEPSPPLPPDQAVDAPTLRPPFLYRNHRFTEPFTALRGQQLTGELSFAQATNLRLEERSSDWTESERRAFLRR